MNETLTLALRRDPVARPPRLPIAGSGPTLRQARFARRLAHRIARALEKVETAAPEASGSTDPTGAFVAPVRVTGFRADSAGRTIGLELCLLEPVRGVRTTVVVEPSLLSAPSAVGPDAAPISIVEGPDRLQRALFLHWLLRLLYRVHASGGPRLHLCALATRDGASSHERAGAALILDLALGCAEGGNVTTGSIEVQLTRSLQEVAERLPPPPRVAVPELRISCPLELGRLRLSYRSASALRAGDLLLLPPQLTRQEGQLVGPLQLTLSPDRVAAGRVTTDQFTVDAIARPTPLAEENPMPHSPSPSALDSVQVDLELRLGKLPLDLETLAALDPGVILPIPPSVADATGGVELLVDARPIGHGELVDFEGRLAVRITSRSR